MIGGAGNDTIFITQDSNNTIVGGSGNDTLDQAAAPGAVAPNLASGTASNAFGGTDMFTNIGAVIGCRFNDTFIAGPGNHTLNGAAGSNE